MNLSPIKIAPPKKWWGNFDQNTKCTVTLITSECICYLELSIQDRTFYNVSNRTMIQIFQKKKSKYIYICIYYKSQPKMFALLTLF